MNIPVRFKGVDYIRIGAFKKPLKNAPERERALWRVFEQTPFENTPIRVGLRTHDVLGLLNYPVYFDLLKHLLPQTLDQIAEILSADRLIQRNIS
ncbi:MAG: MloB, partial [Rhodobacteraceae bacterium]|nr:MloB [Paracoccaceae bacterium]